MEWIRNYVLTLTAAGILCALVRSLAGKAGRSRGFSLACGAFLILAALGPLRRLPLPVAGESWKDLKYEISQEQSRTLEAIQRQTDAVIAEKTRAYIEDKGPWGPNWRWRSRWKRKTASASRRPWKFGGPILPT